MLLKCNAKINLGLSITEKRVDGFHNLESIFIPVPWYDEIEILEANKTKFTSVGIEIDGKPENNLCLKAYQLLAMDFILPPVQIHLDKQIPIGAGLGGGSSDSAFILKGLNDLFSLNLSLEKLRAYARLLGADCAFFVRNETSFVSGIGEVLEPISFKPEGFCLMVNPNIYISTKEAYAAIQPQEAVVNLKHAITKPKEKWQKLIVNDFEAALLPQYPVLQKLKDKLLDMGAYYVAMSGSGSTYYAFFETEPVGYDFDSYQVKAFNW